MNFANVISLMCRRIAIASFQGSVAPRFESAGHFLIRTLGDKEQESSELVACAGCEGFGRVRLLQDHNVDVLICGGIKAFYRSLLESLKLTVIENVSLSVEQALASFSRGELKAPAKKNALNGSNFEIPHEDLLCWTKELFECHGYQVSVAKDKAPFPIDLIATIECPVCHKSIRTAVCCGAHTYRADQEIREFHHATTAAFQARIYVHPGTPSVCESCREYGIQLIDPNLDETNRDKTTTQQVPLLRQPVVGHERAFGEAAGR
jgi:predicted Fe-Mo cluster-binding NifX family protein